MSVKCLFASMVLCLSMFGMVSCGNRKGGNVKPAKCFEMVSVQPNTSMVLWDPAIYNFEKANKFCLEYFRKTELEKQNMAAAACTSWRNGSFHGRNLDWYRANYGCLIIQMPKGPGVPHASVGTINSSTIVTQDFISKGVISDELRQVLPAATTDGINDAGVAININIVPHQPGDKFNGYREDAISSHSIVRYVLDNAGSVKEAVKLIGEKYICQSIIAFAGDETHYMISDKDITAVVEFPHGEMKVTYFENNGRGWYSKNENPAIMANFYDCVAEEYGTGTDAFYENHPTAMGVERWQTVKEQFANAKKDVASNLAIAQSVWYFKGLMTDKKLWYTENAVPESGYGKDANGWFFFNKGQRTKAANAQEAMKGYWDANMKQYWTNYEERYGKLADPHVEKNSYWETSHTVIYDVTAKKGYLYPFENYYNSTGNAIEMELP